MAEHATVRQNMEPSTRGSQPHPKDLVMSELLYDEICEYLELTDHQLEGYGLRRATLLRQKEILIAESITDAMGENRANAYM